MADVRFYSDEHIAKAVIAGLRQRGVDVRTAPEAGLLGATDIMHLADALENGRVILTQDTDFLVLAANGADHAGIAYAPQHTPAGSIIRGAMLIVRAMTADEMRGKVEFL